ncbi:MAG: hypothetical protein Q4B82_08525 [Alysiella sp.]|uniref:hypothetical protein n=1 Tax=Alysiella sp. TaxID=1872483 RepID=UPI0026DD8AF6|nr:hypothetical protein [Alysiella sp.]MDO4434606.1 hypothetical protein [Alysiella sp.]
MKKTIILTAFTAVLLSACSSEPSEQDIKNTFAKSAVPASMQSMSAIVTAGTGDSSMEDLTKNMLDNMSISKLGSCSKVDGEGKRYQCPIRVEMKAYEYNGMTVPENSYETTVYLMRTDDGWVSH